MGLIQIIGEARAVGGRGAVMALVKRDGRLYDAAAVIEQCRNAEQAGRWKATTRK